MEEDFSNKTKENVITDYKNIKNELNKTNKKNQKLEEGYIKLTSELKNHKNDKIQIEQFLKLIFPKETHESSIQKEAGLYEFEELRKVWLVTETKRDNELQKILNQNRQELSDLNEKHNNQNALLDDKNKEVLLLKANLEDNSNQLNLYLNNHRSISKKLQEIENEKNYLLNMIDDKNNEIEKLQHFEIEIAEIKAKYLLMNDEDDSNDYFSNDYIKEQPKNNISQKKLVEVRGKTSNLLFNN